MACPQRDCKRGTPTLTEQDSARAGALKLRTVDNSFARLPGLGESMCVAGREPDQGAIMAKRKKHSKAPKRKVAPARSKAHKVAKTAKRAVAKAKPKPAPVKKVVARVKQPIAPVVETVAAEVIEQPAP